MKRFLLCAGFALLLSGAAIAEEHQARPSGEQEKSEGHEKNLTPWKWANFVLLAGGLGFLIYKTAGPFFRNRSEEIRRGIEGAAKMKAEADARYSAMEHRLAHLDDEIASLKKDAAAEVAAEAARLGKETEHEVGKIHEQALRDIDSAAKAARQELRAYSAELAVELARERIRERITPQDQDALVKSLAGDLKRKASLETV